MAGWCSEMLNWVACHLGQDMNAAKSVQIDGSHHNVVIKIQCAGRAIVEIVLLDHRPYH
jgi:hypothetical protein